MAYKFACLAAVLLSLYVSAVVAQTCSEQVLGGIRGIAADVDFSSSQVLPQPLLIEFDDRYLGQGWPVLTIDSLTQPTVFRQLDCSRVELFNENCNDPDGDYRLEQVDNVDPTIVVGSELGYLLGGNRVAFSDINCQSAVVATAKLETSLDISLGSFSISGSNEDGANECAQDSGLVYEFDDAVNIEPWAGRGFILTFRDFELGKVNLLAEISILTGDGAISESFVLDDRAVRGTSFFFAWSEFPGAADGLRNFLGLSLVFKGVVDDDYGISLFSTFSHFVTGNLNAGCEGSINECVRRPGCVATLTGFDALFEEDVMSTFHFSDDYQAEGIADEDAFAVLPFNTFDWLRYVTCHSSGYFWFQVNPGVYTVTVDCAGEDVQSPSNAANFCVALGDNDIFDLDDSINCVRDPEFADIVCLDSRESDDGPYCERGSSSDIAWPQNGFFNLDDDFVKCINFPFVITDIGLELECSVEDKDCSEPWPEPEIDARDPVCDTVIEPELISETHEGDSCEETTTWVYRARNGDLSERCTVTSTSTDTTAPEWTVRPGDDKIFGCADCENGGCEFDEVDAEDDCTDPVITMRTRDSSDECSETTTRTWFLTDECGNDNDENLRQRIIVRDLEPPQITSCPKDISASCGIDGGALSAEVLGKYPEWTDDCAENVTITHDDELTDGCDECESVVLRTWTVSDQCSGSSTCVQQISIQDRNAPTLFAPADAWVGCYDDHSPDYTGYAVACDDCDPSPTVFWTDSSFDTCECATCEQYTTWERTWWAMDRCENRSPDVVQTITSDPCPPCETVVEHCVFDCTRGLRRLCNLEDELTGDNLENAENACNISNRNTNCFNRCTNGGNWEPWPMGPIV